MSEVEKLREALSRIAEISRTATGSKERSYEHGGNAAPLVCTPKSLPKELQVRAARTAAEVNPVNAPAFPSVQDEALAALVTDPMFAAVVTTKYWGPARRQLTVSFMEPTPEDLQKRILDHLNAWECGVQFVHTSETGQVRISREAGGYWSYLGTDILHIALSRPTMNLESFTMGTPDREFRRVVRHEGGHTLGFPHEHMRRELVARIEPERAYEYFLRTQGWSRPVVDQQVLTPLDERSIIASEADETSIMCYQLPGEITRDGRPILGGLDINATDRTFAHRIYPPATGATRRRQEEEYAGAEMSLLHREDFVEEPIFVD